MGAEPTLRFTRHLIGDAVVQVNALTAKPSDR